MTKKHTLTRRTLLGATGFAFAVLTLSGNAAANGRFQVTFTDAEWRRRLGPDRYRILRQAGTERAGSSALNNEHRRGRFVCAGCANPLFTSTTKFDSGTGWPSFYQALPNAVLTRGGRGMLFGTEILCARCGGHLGHVFNDGPQPTGLRYCMNGLALRLQPA